VATVGCPDRDRAGGPLWPWRFALHLYLLCQCPVPDSARAGPTCPAEKKCPCHPLRTTKACLLSNSKCRGSSPARVRGSLLPLLPRVFPGRNRHFCAFSPTPSGVHVFALQRAPRQPRSTCLQGLTPRKKNDVFFFIFGRIEREREKKRERTKKNKGRTENCDG
jgi:hypothetical protein